jgi:hypothetical protein
MTLGDLHEADAAGTTDLYCVDVGAYDPVPWERQFDEVTRTGAYPLLWDMHVDREGEIDPDAGCAIRGGLTSTDLTLTEAMTEAGYRSRTGLIQAFAFDEPIAWEHRPTDRLAVFPTGGVFLQASQALHRQGPHGEATDPTVSQHVHAVVEAATQAAGLHDPDVVVLQDLSSEIGADDGYVSDFQAQCGESTGGFTSRWSLTRACSGQGNCTASASVTRALVDIGDASDAYLAHERWAQPFPAGHREAFPGGLQAWTDVDLLGPG